jgi:hypothetical protein
MDLNTCPNCFMLERILWSIVMTCKNPKTYTQTHFLSKSSCSVNVTFMLTRCKYDYNSTKYNSL